MKRTIQKRIDRICGELREDEAFLVQKPEEVTYLTGFTGDDSMLFVTSKGLYFITDGRYIEQIKAEALVGLEIEETNYTRKIGQVFQGLVRKNRIKKILTAKKDISLDFYETLASCLSNDGTEFQNSDLIRKMRIVKDEFEIETIRQNLIITELGYHTILPLIEEGKTESEIAGELEFYLRKQGALKTSFDTIVASGERSAFPHGVASGKKIKKDEIVMFDFGIKKDGYCSDFTRCYYFGTIIIPKISEIHKVVYDALKLAESLVKPGIQAKEIHKAAYGLIEKAGYADNFWHSTGHGVGLEIHELPGINFTDETVLEEGMVFTVEPGIYLPGLGGIRLEDMVVVTNRGHKVLTTSDFDL